MKMDNSEFSFCFQQIHIDGARNSTDDFNPFHDPHKYQDIRGNPYQGTIALGFQLECLIEYLVNLHRDAQGEHGFILENGLHFGNYQLTFANALLAGEAFRVEVKPTVKKLNPPSLSNRVVVRKSDSMVILGHRRETLEPLYSPDDGFLRIATVMSQQQQATLADPHYYMKRKHISAANAKNFTTGSLCDQYYYFDVLENRVNYPAMYSCALTSCTLLEKAMSEKYDFMANPMVYMAHNISIDRRLSLSLRTNEELRIVVHGPQIIAGEKGLGKSELTQQLFCCLGLIRDNQPLYYAEVYMAPLAAIVAATRADTLGG
jgi:hypothetical protein